MKTQYYYRGKLFESLQESGMPLLNRSFLYGDGFFETLRYSNQKIFNRSNHIQRIKNTSKTLGQVFDYESVLKEIEAFLFDQFKATHLRLRITFFRSGEGKYRPESDAVWDWILTIKELEHQAFELNDEGLKIGVYKDQKKMPGALSGIKSTSAQLYVQAADFVAKHYWEDALLLNHKEHIIEATASNIFAIKSGYLFTPALSEGPVAGTMRALMLQSAFELGLTASSGPLTLETLQNADEVWLCNAIQGIRWVAEIEGHSFDQKKYAGKAIEYLNSL